MSGIDVKTPGSVTFFGVGVKHTEDGYIETLSLRNLKGLASSIISAVVLPFHCLGIVLAVGLKFFPKVRPKIFSDVTIEGQVRKVAVFALSIIGGIRIFVGAGSKDDTTLSAIYDIARYSFMGPPEEGDMQHYSVSAFKNTKFDKIVRAFSRIFYSYIDVQNFPIKKRSS